MWHGALPLHLVAFGQATSEVARTAPPGEQIQEVTRIASTQTSSQAGNV